MDKENKANSDYSIYSKITDFKDYINQYMINEIPENKRNLRIHFQDEMYQMSKNMFYATYNKGNVRMKYLVELQVNISMIDMMLLEIKKIKSIKKSRLDASISKLSDIKNIVYGWKLREESKSK